jgi:hypothetical protein
VLIVVDLVTKIVKMSEIAKQKVVFLFPSTAFLFCKNTNNININKTLEYYLIKEIDLAAHLLQTLHYSLSNEAK